MAEQPQAQPHLALFSYGFRPFFLGGPIWIALAMVLWMAALSGAVSLPTAFDPVSWHAHAFLFGYLGAVIAGFLLTAVPNWTGRAPMAGWPLAVLFGLWAAGRLAVLLSAYLPVSLVAAIDLSFLLALAAIITREIVAAKNWRNLIVVGLLALLLCANALFHLETASGQFAASGSALRIGVSASVLLIALIGGRIVPSFTRNWLAKRGMPRQPAPPMQRFDVVALLGLALALCLWSAMPFHPLSSAALAVAGVLHAIRLARWAGWLTLAEPLVWVLHLAYGFVPLGAFAVALSGLRPDILAPGAALHLWMAGAIGLMTLAVMSRATLGHTGHPLTAGRGTICLYVCLITSVVFRLMAGLAPASAEFWQLLSACFWIAAFGGFALLYGPKLIHPRKAG